MKNNIHYFEEEEEFATKGYTLNFDKHLVQAKKVAIKNANEFRQKAEKYMKDNDFETCFIPDYIIKDEKVKTLIRKLLPDGTNKQALVGYDYINHLKVFGFNTKQLETLYIEDHEDHENTVLLYDYQKRLVYYIRISTQEKFEHYQVVTELKRCNDFLKSFLLLHEDKVKGDNLAVCAILALTNVSSSDIDSVNFKIYDHLKHFLICKEDIENNYTLISKLDCLHCEIQETMTDHGVMPNTSPSITTKLRQMLSESMATMVLIDTILPRLTNDPYKKIVSLLLNKEQYEVINHPDKHISITAGYGCGKTLILLEIAKKLFLSQENSEVIYICYDRYSLLPARVKMYFEDLQEKHPKKNNVKLRAIGNSYFILFLMLQII